MNPFSSIAWVPGSELRLLGLRQQVPLPAELPHWTDFFLPLVLGMEPTTSHALSMRGLRRHIWFM